MCSLTREEGGRGGEGNKGDLGHETVRLHTALRGHCAESTESFGAALVRLRPRVGWQQAF